VKIKVYVIDFETPRWVRKGLAYGVPLIVVLGVAAVVVAAPVQWSTSETLTATKMNAITVITTDAGVSYSVGATTYCGTGPTSTVGGISYNGTGYAGAKALCQASTACGSDPSAHMCTSEEIIRSSQLGISVPAGWYSTSIWGVAGSPLSAATNYGDCNGWSVSDSGHFGSFWSPNPDTRPCSDSEPILCCN
jgi:hypothetical protein